jgi:hypothetical protein
MAESWWRVYRREWSTIFNSDATGDAGRREALEHAALIPPETDPDTWRVVPWSETRQDDWPWSLEVKAPLMRGEFQGKINAEKLADMLGGCIVVEKGSSEDKQLIEEQRFAQYLRG